MRIQLQFAGANDNGDRPTHIMAGADSVWHAGMRVAWVRWVKYKSDGLHEYGDWQPVIPDKPVVPRKKGRLG